jgi:hypothetical protein
MPATEPQLATLLGIDEELASRVTLSALGRPFTALAVQTVHSGIDYATLGQGWNHPQARISYRNADGPSFGKSRERQERSRKTLAALANTLIHEPDAGSRLVAAFCSEIGRPQNTGNATFAAVSAALEAELVLPLRALSEGIVSMTRTFNGAPVPRADIERVVDEIVAHVLDGSFSEWRYTNAVGVRQLEGLSAQQIAIWREPTSMSHTATLETHEDREESSFGCEIPSHTPIPHAHSAHPIPILRPRATPPLSRPADGWR